MEQLTVRQWQARAENDSTYADDKLPRRVYAHYQNSEDGDKFFVIQRYGARIVIESDNWRHIWHWQLGATSGGYWAMFDCIMVGARRFKRTLYFHPANNLVYCERHRGHYVHIAVFGSENKRPLTAASIARIRYVIFGPSIIRGFCRVISDDTGVQLESRSI